jgi:hypothetical protein
VLFTGDSVPTTKRLYWWDRLTGKELMIYKDRKNETVTEESRQSNSAVVVVAVFMDTN